MEEVQKKGMSRGCLVALIVAGALLLLIVVIAVTCYVKKDDLAKWGVTSLVTKVKTDLAKTPVTGVDTVKFDALADKFLARFNAEKLDFQKLNTLMLTVQRLSTTKTLDSTKVSALTTAITEYYPDLESSESAAPQGGGAVLQDTGAAKTH
ncbi:MAG TPA: hypothetical protein VMS71_06035 [Candidatus Acidoferrum sp.]|nr:hypothetical protein [Candidatus Acidoferrum sp.]